MIDGVERVDYNGREIIKTFVRGFGNVRDTWRFTEERNGYKHTVVYKEDGPVSEAATHLDEVFIARAERLARGDRS